MASVPQLALKLAAKRSVSPSKDVHIAAVAQALIRRGHPILAASLMSIRYVRGILLAVAVIIAAIMHRYSPREVPKVASIAATK